MADAQFETYSGVRKTGAKPTAIGAAIVGLIALALSAGFVGFVSAIPKPSTRLPAAAQGIVALTGDAARVRDAVALLAAGRGSRLLITGVNRTTTRGELAALSPGSSRLFKCCIDLGYAAMNTAGNASETLAWARRLGFRNSLIIVTSTYHMPRALEDMRTAMPNVALTPYSVAAPKLQKSSWWRNPSSLFLLGREYLKYLFAVARTETTGRRWLPHYSNPSHPPETSANE